MSQYFAISGMKYRPSHVRKGATHQTAANSLARSIDRKWKAEFIKAAPGGMVYSEAYGINDENGEPVPGTLFYVTAHKDIGISEKESSQLANASS